MTRFLLCIVLSVSAVLAQSSAFAAVDLFLNLDGVTGESTDKAHLGWIEIASFQFGVTSPTTIGSATGGAGSGRASFSDLSITKKVDKSSPTLLLDVASGRPIQDARLDVVKVSDGKEGPFLEYKFNEVFISSYSVSGSEGDSLPSESVTLKFAKIEVKEISQNSDGSLGQSVGANWDLVLNKGGPIGAVPEPATLGIFLAGLGLLGLQVGRRRKT